MISDLLLWSIPPNLSWKESDHNGSFTCWWGAQGNPNLTPPTPQLSFYGFLQKTLENPTKIVEETKWVCYLFIGFSRLDHLWFVILFSSFLLLFALSPLIFRVPPFVLYMYKSSEWVIVMIWVGGWALSLMMGLVFWDHCLGFWTLDIRLRTVFFFPDCFNCFFLCMCNKKGVGTDLVGPTPFKIGPSDHSHGFKLPVKELD